MVKKKKRKKDANLLAARKFIPVAYVFDSPRMVMNGGDVDVDDVAAAADVDDVAAAVAVAVVDLTVFAIIHVVFAEVCAVVRDCWMSINVREAIESPDLEFGMIEGMTNQQPWCHGLRSVAAMKFSLVE